MAVLRGWGVVGDDAALRAAAAQVGHHALSVAVLGSYLRSFADGRIEAVERVRPRRGDGRRPEGGQARTGARLLRGAAAGRGARAAGPALRVPPRRDARSARRARRCRRRGGGTASEGKAAPRRRCWAACGRAGWSSSTAATRAVTWTAHPFLRERFRELLGCPAEQVFDVVAQALGAGLEKRPDTKPSDPTCSTATNA